MNWQSYPKTELHLHLEGAAAPQFVLEKAQKKGVDVSLAIEGGNYVWRDFSHFLKTYEEVMKVLKDPQDFYELTASVLARQLEHGVRYTEIFLGSVLMCDNDPVLWREMMAAIETAAEEAESEIVARFIIVAVRHFGADSAIETATLAAKNPSARLTGFGMAGAEDFGRPSDFVKAFDAAREAGLGLTCHAGEWCGSEPILETIEALKVSRLGHGVRASENGALLDLMKERDIHAEICPGSNVALGAYLSWKEHPITMMRDRGVSFSISTDDPPYFSTQMTREYEELVKIGWAENDFALSNQEAMRHAFCDEVTREKILKNWS